MGNVYIISGSDDFSRKKRARELALQLGGNDPDDPGIEIITSDSDTVKPDQLAAPFVESISGDYSKVGGLPVCRLSQLLTPFLEDTL